MGELRIDCRRCGIEFEVTAERVRATSVAVGEFEKAFSSIFGIKSEDSKTQYRIYCPKCNRAIAKFSCPLIGI